MIAYHQGCVQVALSRFRSRCSRRIESRGLGREPQRRRLRRSRTKCVSEGPGGEAPWQCLKFVNSLNRKLPYKNALVNLQISLVFSRFSDLPHHPVASHVWIAIILRNHEAIIVPRSSSERFESNSKSLEITKP